MGEYLIKHGFPYDDFSEMRFWGRVELVAEKDGDDRFAEGWVRYVGKERDEEGNEAGDSIWEVRNAKQLGHPLQRHQRVSKGEPFRLEWVKAAKRRTQL